MRAAARYRLAIEVEPFRRVRASGRCLGCACRPFCAPAGCSSARDWRKFTRPPGLGSVGRCRASAIILAPSPLLLFLPGLPQAGLRASSTSAPAHHIHLAFGAAECFLLFLLPLVDLKLSSLDDRVLIRQKFAALGEEGWRAELLADLFEGCEDQRAVARRSALRILAM